MARVAYVVSNELAQVSSLLPSNKNRSALVHTLAKALGLLSRVQIIRPAPATRSQLLAFHDAEYIDALLDAIVSPEFGLEDDCHPFPALGRYVGLVAGASLSAARSLLNPDVDVAICWDGGRHHAQKARAAGFCFANDCVLDILALRHGGGRSRVLYLDLDVHFGDAVAHAFFDSNQVLTLSIHHASPGFFPSTPLAALGKTSPYSLSLPLHCGASDRTFARVWMSCVEPIRVAFAPDIVVVQCGVDGLVGDPWGIWKWSLMGDNADCGPGEGSFGWCVQEVLRWPCKALLLGGGGYNSPNAARAWAYLTSLALGVPLSPSTSIPSHTSHPFFPHYEPSFTLDVPAGSGFVRDENLSATPQPLRRDNESGNFTRGDISHTPTDHDRVLSQATWLDEVEQVFEWAVCQIREDRGREESAEGTPHPS